MTGWRIGWTLSPANIAKAMGDLQSQETSNPCSVSQYAAVAALGRSAAMRGRHAGRVCQAARFCQTAAGKDPRRELSGNGRRFMRFVNIQEAPGQNVWRCEVRQFGPVVPGAVGATKRGDRDGLGIWGRRLRAHFIRHSHGRFGSRPGSHGGFHRQREVRSAAIITNTRSSRLRFVALV